MLHYRSLNKYAKQILKTPCYKILIHYYNGHVQMYFAGNRVIIISWLITFNMFNVKLSSLLQLI